jgi:L-fuculose-phosphate aldolase
LRNHGLLSVGPSLTEAYQAARDGEWLAKVYYRARMLGAPTVLTRDEISRVQEQFRQYGQTPRI